MHNYEYVSVEGYSIKIPRAFQEMDCEYVNRKFTNVPNLEILHVLWR